MRLETLLGRKFLSAMPESAKRRLMSAGESSPLSKTEELKRKAEQYNASLGDLNKYEDANRYGVYDCPKCLNRGFFAFPGDDGVLHFEECACMATRESLRYIRRSGLSELLARYTLEAWQCREPWQKNLLDMVNRYAESPEGWFCLSGTPGTGKTHLCTALCGLLMERGFQARYMLWKDVSTKAKAVVNDNEAYQELVEPLKSVRVLYIDDLFKTGKAVNRVTGQREAVSPTTGDINLAFEILNARYCDSRLLTIISTEMSLGQILDIDEAVGSRIVERTRGYYQDLTPPYPEKQKRNWRLTR